ncbi:MAG: HAMP domain-containing histidine kinase [Anaerolineales bacterium]|nr:HAMP domain-containing histidine kinase [Anaerolineales bacterium]
MNRLWVRISLTFVGIVVFVILIPLTYALLTHSFEGQVSFQDKEPYPETHPSEFENAPVSQQIRNAPGRFIVEGLWRTLVVVFVIGSISGIISSRSLTAPLNKLEEAAKAIGSRELGRRVEVQGTDEVKAVARAFNEMAADLERAEAQRSNLLNDVAHELRTPIAVIQGNLRAIIDDVYEMDKTEIIRLYDQTRHLSRLVDDLRQLAQAEANQLPMNIVSVDLAALIQDVASIFMPTIEAENLKLQLQLEEDVPLIKGDRSRLSQCVQNLLINAIHHTPSGGEISIKLIKDGTDVHIEVIDTGRGIPEEHLPYIFDRFYRADPARDRETGGTGLGLAITRSFIQAHHGEIWAASQGSGKGSTFHVRLPILSGAPVAEMD